MFAETRKKEVGEVLKAERARKGLSLDEVQRAIKINKKFIKALEDNDFSIMPTKVAAKGFLKTYAGYLEVNVEPYIVEIREKIGEDKSDKTKISQAPKEDFSAPNIPAGAMQWGLYAIGGFAVLLVLLIAVILAVRK